MFRVAYVIMCTRLALVITLVATFAGTARADDIDSLINPKRLASCDVLLAPNGQVRRPCALTAAELTGGDSGVTLKVIKKPRTSFPKSMLEYVEADVEARKGGKL